MKPEAGTAPRGPQPLSQPVAQAPTQAQPAAVGSKNVATMRRGEPDLRSPMQRMETPSSALMADGMVFAQLIQPAGPISDDDSGLGGGGAALATKPDAAGAQLVDELAQRLPIAPPGTFTATLLMPNLGKVQVRAGKREGHWDVELGLARRETFKRLHSQRGACEAALATAMGSPVRLAMVDEADA